MLPGPDVGRLLLDRLVAEGVRYGRDFALVRISVPLGSAEDSRRALGVPARRRRDRALGGRRAARAAARHRPPGRRARRASACARPSTSSSLVGAAHWVGDPATTCSPARAAPSRQRRAEPAPEALGQPAHPELRRPPPPRPRVRRRVGRALDRHAAQRRDVLERAQLVRLLDQRAAHRTASRGSRRGSRARGRPCAGACRPPSWRRCPWRPAARRTGRRAAR